MNSTPRPEPGQPAIPGNAGHAQDFVAVDDSGEFSYHRSEEELLPAFEYVGEAACIIDRSGDERRLALAPDRRLVLGPATGPVEFHWLRQAWLAAQDVHPDALRLRRFYPETLTDLLQDLFETLALEAGPAVGYWTVVIEGVASHTPDLQEIDRRLSHGDELDDVHVQDPFGHTYRPVRRRRHWYLPASAGFICYVEVRNARRGSHDHA
jgi:hypothetical protein